LVWVLWWSIQNFIILRRKLFFSTQYKRKNFFALFHKASHQKYQQADGLRRWRGQPLNCGQHKCIQLT
jgi:hypothetical protein